MYIHFTFSIRCACINIILKRVHWVYLKVKNQGRPGPVGHASALTVHARDYVYFSLRTCARKTQRPTRIDRRYDDDDVVGSIVRRPSHKHFTRARNKTHTNIIVRARRTRRLERGVYLLPCRRYVCAKRTAGAPRSPFPRCCPITAFTVRLLQ
jgi:hypothetical protein